MPVGHSCDAAALLFEYVLRWLAAAQYGLCSSEQIAPTSDLGAPSRSCKEIQERPFKCAGMQHA